MLSDCHPRKSEKREGLLRIVEVHNASPLIMIAFSDGLKMISRRVSLATMLMMSFWSRLKSITEKMYV